MKIFGFVIIKEDTLWSAIVDPLIPMVEEFRKDITDEVEKGVHPIVENKDYTRPYLNEIEGKL